MKTSFHLLKTTHVMSQLITVFLRALNRVGRSPFAVHSLLLSLTLLAPLQSRADNPRTPIQQTIQGTVVDAQNQPVAGARVFIESRDWFESDLPNLETTTDAQGRFKLTDDLWHIQGQTLQTRDSQNRMAQLSLPGPSLRDPKRLELNDLCLQLTPPKRIELEVVDAKGKPVPAALTGIMDFVKNWGTGKTDSAGKITFQIPPDVDLKYVAALRDGYGADYFVYTTQREANSPPEFRPDPKIPKFPDNPVRLTLAGAQPLKVKLVSAEGQPLPGIKIAPWIAHKSDQSRPMPLPQMFYAIQQITQTTDAQGTTVFAWIPHWQKQRMYLVLEERKYIPHRIFYDPAKDKGTLTVQLTPKPPAPEQDRKP